MIPMLAQRFRFMTTLGAVAIAGVALLADPASPSGAAGGWVLRPSMPTPRSELAVTAGPHSSIYTIGGATSTGYVATVEVYTPTAMLWHTVAPLPSPRGDLGAALGADGHVYAIGGVTVTPSGDQFLHTVDAYNPASDTWRAQAPMPTARGNAGVVTGLGGRIYVIGGSAGGPALNTVEAYTPATHRWTTLAPLPTARWGLAATVDSKGRIYAIGGTNGSDWLNTVEMYTPQLNAWQELAPLPTPRADLAAATGNDGLVYAIGGLGYIDSYGDSGVLNTVEAYNPASSTWQTMPSMPTARRYLGAAAGGDGLVYAIGGIDGYGGGSELGNVEAYMPQASPTLTLTPNSGPAGSSTMAAGTGFGAGETVVLKLYCSSVTCHSRSVLGMVTANGAGAFSISVTIPSIAPTGGHEVGAIGQTSGAFADRTFTVTP